MMRNILFDAVLLLMTIAALSFVIWPLWRHARLSIINAVLLLLVFPGAALLLYHHWGASSQLQHYWLAQKQEKLVQAELQQIKNPQQIIQQLQQHLVQYPQSAQGWYLLGRLYFALRHYSEAYQALERAYRLKPANRQYLVSLAEAQFFRDHNRLNTQSLQLLQQVVSQSPSNVAAVNLLAINAYLQKNYGDAIHYWESLLSVFPPNSQDDQTIMSMIARAQQHLGKKMAVPVSLQVQVVLDAELGAKNSATVPLYIFALAASGSPMPLAVVKTTVKDLPLTVKLGAAQSMLPGRILLPNMLVKVIARVARSYSPLPHAGDWESAPKELTLHAGTNKVSLKINQIVK